MKCLYIRYAFSMSMAAWLLFSVLTVAAIAQTAAPQTLPTAPGADRAVVGGLTSAKASLPGGPDRSPLEPYLVFWLLPASGILCVAAGIYVDRRVMSKSRPRR